MGEGRAEFSQLVLAILAAGASQRFGQADKLTADLRGKMLGHHVTDNLSGLDFMRRVIIASAPDHECTAGWQRAGFEIAVNGEAQSGLGTSAALAACIARGAGAAGLIICLADMPFITVQHIERLAESWDGSDGAMVASDSGQAASPPALFGAGHFDMLSRLTGDSGARSLLPGAQLVSFESAALTDIDRPEDLAKARDRA
ncbi:NTP transferase domain-containing protein [Sphingorhabdus arenilitoris]|uniref:NTP transferase domain-containing protein n=1 Tax=Sphingorhabdus arenilitoris TaxID=1490041 RepID=A0ABV8RII6_9SPHN